MCQACPLVFNPVLVIDDASFLSWESQRFRLLFGGSRQLAGRSPTQCDRDQRRRPRLGRSGMLWQRVLRNAASRPAGSIGHAIHQCLCHLPGLQPLAGESDDGKYPARIGMTAHVGDAQPEHWTRDTPLTPPPYVSDLPHEEITLAERFHRSGYATMHAGKWHLGGERHWPEYHGFDVNVAGWSQGGPFGGSCSSSRRMPIPASATAPPVSTCHSG